MEEQLKNIVEKVSALYQRYGIRSVTMDDVSRHLGISKKTLYSCVKDKEELVALTIQLQVEDHKAMEENLKSRNLGALEEIMEIYTKVAEVMKNMNPSYQYDLRKYYPHLCDNFLKYKRENLFHVIKSNLQRGKGEGIYRAEINEEIIAHMHTSRHNSMNDMEPEEIAFLVGNDAFKEIFFYHIHAIINDKGREILKEKKFFEQ